MSHEIPRLRRGFCLGCVNMEAKNTYCAKGGLEYTGFLGLTMRATMPCAEITLKDNLVKISISRFEKFAFDKDDIVEVREKCFLLCQGLQFIHKKEKYPSYIVFTFFKIEEMHKVKQKIGDMGFNIVDS